MSTEERDYTWKRSPYNLQNTEKEKRLFGMRKRFQKHYDSKIVLKQRVAMNTGMNYVPKSLVFGVIILLAIGGYMVTKITNRVPITQQNAPQRQARAQPSEEKIPPNQTNKVLIQAPVKTETINDLTREREKAFSDVYRPDRSCESNTSELRKLECRNRADTARTQFFAQWNRANADRFPK